MGGGCGREGVIYGFGRGRECEAADPVREGLEREGCGGFPIVYTL